VFLNLEADCGCAFLMNGTVSRHQAFAWALFSLPRNHHNLIWNLSLGLRVKGVLLFSRPQEKIMVAKTETTADNAKLQADVDALRKDLAEVTKTLKTIGGEAAQTKTQAAAERIREVSSQARDQFDHARDVAVDQVRERPLSSVAVTFGVGLLVGRLLQK